MIDFKRFYMRLNNSKIKKQALLNAFIFSYVCPVNFTYGILFS